MKKKACFLMIACCILVAGLWAKDPSPEQLVSDHLNSIGESAALSQVKSITFL